MAHDGADVTLGQGILLDDLMSLTGAAIAPAEEVLEKAKQAVRATVVEDGRVSGKLIEANQFAAHGLAWLATYVESLRQMQLLRAQLLARTSALATLRNAYYVEVVRTKRMLLESGLGIGYAQVAPDSRSNLDIVGLTSNPNL